MSSQTPTRPGNNQSGNNQNKKNEPSRSQGESNETSVGPEDFYDMLTEVSDSVQQYCSRRPKVAAGLLFGLGFIVGWKLKPW